MEEKEMKRPGFEAQKNYVDLIIAIGEVFNKNEKYVSFRLKRVEAAMRKYLKDIEEGKIDINYAFDKEHKDHLFLISDPKDEEDENRNYLTLASNLENNFNLVSGILKEATLSGYIDNKIDEIVLKPLFNLGDQEYTNEDGLNSIYNFLLDDGNKANRINAVMDGKIITREQKIEMIKNILNDFEDFNMYEEETITTKEWFNNLKLTNDELKELFLLACINKKENYAQYIFDYAKFDLYKEENIMYTISRRSNSNFCHYFVADPKPIIKYYLENGRATITYSSLFSKLGLDEIVSFAIPNMKFDLSMTNELRHHFYGVGEYGREEYTIRYIDTIIEAICNQDSITLDSPLIMELEDIRKNCNPVLLRQEKDQEKARLEKQKKLIEEFRKNHFISIKDEFLEDYSKGKVITKTITTPYYKLDK